MTTDRQHPLITVTDSLLSNYDNEPEVLDVNNALSAYRQGRRDAFRFMRKLLDGYLDAKAE
jgi:hypothetical protein